ncbi:HNH endonuclease [Williamsia sterculiae]|uniref:HNH endonuclease n=1 Tax=Williamsia sterculiae TaxID=1344003 RepID=UPI0011805E29|nr:HNH endonuclease signature motif containing protein [Williamsia sterculiae]
MHAGMFTEMGDLLVDELDTSAGVVNDVDADIIAAIGGAVRLRAVTDHLLAVLAAQAERVGVAKRSGMKTRELLVANGMAPVAADRCLRVGRAVDALASPQRYSSNGFLSGEHVDAVVRGVAHVSTRTKQPVGSEAITTVESTLVGQAISGASPAELMALARAVAVEAAPAGDTIPAAEDATLNEMGWHQVDDGRLQGTFDLDVLTGERLICAVDTASRPRPLPDGTPDPRSAGRRRADAFGQLLQCGVRAAADDAMVSAPRTEVMVTVPLEDRNTARLGWLGSISDRAAKLVGCDAGITRVDLDQHGVPTAVSATKRLFTGAVRKAVIVRDQCCVKCGAPASWTDCHHIVHHADGGPTILDNGCLLCRSCHTAVHHQGWEVVIGHDRHP